MRKIMPVALLMNLVLVNALAQDAPAPAAQFISSGTTFFLLGDLKSFTAAFSSRQQAPELDLITLTLRSDRKMPPPPLTIRWSYPLLNAAGEWTTARGLSKNLNNHDVLQSRTCTQAPVVQLFGYDDRNRLSFACSDALNTLRLQARVNETTAMVDCEVQLFAEAHPATDQYAITIRVDRRDQPYWKILKEVSRWWEGMVQYVPARVPDQARWPMYSTWYSFHQALDAGAIEKQCTIARQLGCESVLIDDGWQMLNNEPGYAYTGDWEPLRIPKMRQLTDRIHAAGLKILLWYSVPFVGERSKACSRFKGKYLYYRQRWKAWALDPRFPDVRQYLVDKYTDALKSWNLDGFKLDFVDLFVPDDSSADNGTEGRDYASVNEAVDRLLTDVITALRSIRPDIMIEFRQSYTGPLMRKYGNMFRAGDTPADAVTNRVSITDIRLLAGFTAVHSDMLMWNKQETATNAALQLLNVLFAVPQLSVKLDELPAEQLKMLAFWLKFWRQNRSVLLDGQFMPGSPTLNYPLITASDGKQQITVVYHAGTVVKQQEGITGKLQIVNAAADNEIILDTGRSRATGNLQVFDCTGKLLADQKLDLRSGLTKITVPSAGLAIIERVP